MGAGEVKTTSTNLLSEDTVLLLEVGDDVLLLPGDPPGKGHQEELQGSRWGVREGASGPAPTAPAQEACGDGGRVPESAVGTSAPGYATP